MKVTTERIPDSQMLLNIEIDDDELETHKNRAYRKLVQNANIPGFRKGKAPRRILEQYLAPGALVQEALESLLPDLTAKAIEDEGIEAAGQPSIEIEETEPQVIIKATVPLAPTVDLGNYQSIRVPWEKAEVTEDDIVEVLDRMQKETAPWEPIERAVEMNDMVTLHIQAWAKGLPPVGSEEEEDAEGKSSDEESTPAEGDEEQERQFMNEDDWTYYPRPESTFPAPGFADEILGMNVNDVREFSITMPEDYNIPDLAGRETRFAVTLKETKGQALDERDDEWAKGVGAGYDSLVALRENVQTDLSERKEQETKLEYEGQVLEKVIDGATLEYAPVLIDHELQHLMTDRAERLRSMGIELNDYLTMADRTLQDLADEVKPDAERRVTNTLILNQLVEETNIEIDDSAVDEEIMRVTGVGEDATPEQLEQLQNLMSSEETRESVLRSLTHRAAMDQLVEMARSDAPVATAEEEAPAESVEESAAEEEAPDNDDSGPTNEDSSETDN